jgi:hypothetical protein
MVTAIIYPSFEQHGIPIANIQNVQDVQQKQGLHLPITSPPKSGRSRGKVITMEGILTSASQKPEGPISPQKMQITSPIANVQITPPKVQMHQISPQTLQMQTPMLGARQLQHLTPVQMLASPKIASVNGPSAMQSPSPHRTAIPCTPKSSLGFVCRKN